MARSSRAVSLRCTALVNQRARWNWSERSRHTSCSASLPCRQHCATWRSPHARHSRPDSARQARLFQSTAIGSSRPVDEVVHRVRTTLSPVPTTTERRNRPPFPRFVVEVHKQVPASSSSAHPPACDQSRASPPEERQPGRREAPGAGSGTPVVRDRRRRDEGVRVQPRIDRNGPGSPNHAVVNRSRSSSVGTAPRRVGAGRSGWGPRPKGHAR